MIIDTHAHLNFNAYKADLDEVIKRTLENDVWIINVGSQYSTSKRAVDIAEKYGEGVFAAVGLHPIHLETGLVEIKEDPEEIQFNTQEESFDYQKYKELAAGSAKVVAIGEVGFDYYWKPKTKKKLELFKEKQREALFQQLKLAKELDLPVIFHCRMAHQDLIEFLKDNLAVRPEKAVAHAFVGTSEELKKYLEFGYSIGFNGIIFKKISGIDFGEVIRNTPLEKILFETDSPYLTPPLMEGRNEPLFVKYVIERVAKVKNQSYEEITKVTTENAKKLFNL
jgi:TatD DNase family protein